jgi:hypothetical protein
VTCFNSSVCGVHTNGRTLDVVGDACIHQGSLPGTWEKTSSDTNFLSFFLSSWTDRDFSLMWASCLAFQDGHQKVLQNSKFISSPETRQFRLSKQKFWSVI